MTIKLIFILVFIPHSLIFSQSGDVNMALYDIEYQEYGERENLLKISVPPYLDTTDLKFQVDILINSIEDDRDRRAFVHIFKDYVDKEEIMDRRSRVTCKYEPGKSYRWDLTDWEPEAVVQPTKRDILMYNTFVDNLLHAEHSGEYEFDPLHMEESAAKIETQIKEEVAQLFRINLDTLNQTCYLVRQWNGYIDWVAAKRASGRNDE